MRFNKYQFSIVTIVLLLIIPIYCFNTKVFIDWDALVSWNRWAIELAQNKYYPMDTAYPILLPSIWSLIYKLQGTTQVNIIAKFSLLYPILIVLLMILSIYRKISKISAVSFLIMIYSHMITPAATSGYMDYPIAFVGSFSLLLLYLAENNKKEYTFTIYICLAIIIAGISIIIKQSGIFFFIFIISYIAVNIKHLSKRSLLTISISTLGSLIFISSFLIIFYKHAHNYAGNLEYLINLTKNNSFSHKIYIFLKGASVLNLIINTLILIITPVLFIYSIYKSPKNIVKLESLTLLAYLIGTIVWLLAFSYDYRNSVWIQMFGITSLSIYISKLLTYKRNTKIYQHNKSKPNLSLTSPIIKATIISLTVIFISLTCNTKLYNFQKKAQANIGGGKQTGLIISNILSKSECSVLYTNDQPVKYNFFLSAYQDRILTGGWSIIDITNIIAQAKSSNCKDDNYLLLNSQKLLDNLLINKKLIPMTSELTGLYRIQRN
ncbi:MAG: hypothetical protein AB8U93_00260 [Francisella endosymbiont of Hyalomma scupense]